ncbi:hypothetical protein T459_14150 [Capsicum annuum]|uniref:BURP domain-containing protein n=1 Tax=Capsicum annuum TaxID=4072 RepID=A0A2G2ZGU2_CAPAN|nr:hypothetical protein T459_14150 [Capsicum annuum]
MVECHTTACPYTVFYCHYTTIKSKVFKVSLRNEANGDRAEAIAVLSLGYL